MDVNACDKCGKTALLQILNTHRFGICVGCGFPIVRGDEFDNARLEAVQGDECHLNMPERIHDTRVWPYLDLKMPPSYIRALDVINAHRRDAFKAEQAAFKVFSDQSDAVVLVERPITCEICGKATKSTYTCQDCEKEYCDDCSAVYTQSTQIDYDCCSSCGQAKAEGHD